MHSIINMVFWSILANYKAALSHQNKVNVGMSFFQNNTLSVGHNYYYTGYNRTIPINHTASLNGTYPTLLKSITDYIVFHACSRYIFSLFIIGLSYTSSMGCSETAVPRLHFSLSWTVSQCSTLRR